MRGAIPFIPTHLPGGIVVDVVPAHSAGGFDLIFWKNEDRDIGRMVRGPRDLRAVRSFVDAVQAGDGP